MRGLAVVAALGVTLSSTPVFAQAPAAQTPPAAPRPAAQQPPATPPAAPAALPAPAPFLAGAKTAFVNLQAIAAMTVDGKAAADKAKALQANQQKLQTSGSVMSDAARTQLEKEIERQQVEGQRFEQDAQSDLQELQQQLQQEFQAKLLPILEVLAKEKGIQVLFSTGDAGVIWIEPGIDLTMEAVTKMDGAKK